MNQLNVNKRYCDELIQQFIEEDVSTQLTKLPEEYRKSFLDTLHHRIDRSEAYVKWRSKKTKPNSFSSGKNFDDLTTRLKAYTYEKLQEMLQLLRQDILAIIHVYIKLSN